MPYRERTYYTGDYLESDIYPITFREKRKKRKAKKEESSIMQKNLNEKNSIRHLIMMINNNFTNKDLAVHLSFDDKHLPATDEEAKKIRDNYILRIRRYRKKMGLPPMKYIIVYAYSDEGENRKRVRKHFHIIMSGMDRDIVEELWGGRGYVNADRLQANEYGYEALARYIGNNPHGQKRWQPSKNLEKPEPRINDSDFTISKVEKLAKCPDDREFYEKRHKGYIFTECKVKWNEVNSRYYLYIKMRKLKE